MEVDKQAIVIGCERRGCVRDGVPPLSKLQPWLLADNSFEVNMEYARYQIFCTIDNGNLHHYHCQIPQLAAGTEVRACFHGWAILATYPDQIRWSLWNPLTSNLIHLPPLTVKAGSNYIRASCLSSPPSDKASVLLLLRGNTGRMFFCHVHHEKKKRRWIEMSCKKQLKAINDGLDDDHLTDLVFCNGKVYGATICGNVILLDIIVVTRSIVIKLLPFVRVPGPCVCYSHSTFFKEYCAQLLAIFCCFKGKKECREFRGLHMFKLDIDARSWEPLENAEDHVFFLDLCGRDSINYSPAVESQFGGGYVHIFDTSLRVFSYNIRDKTLSLSPPPCLDLEVPKVRGAFSTAQIAVWVMPECRLEHDDQKPRCDQVQNQEEATVSDHVQNPEPSALLTLPLHILESIAERCLAVEYLNLRATCKLCRSAAPLTQWSTPTALERLQTQEYSLVSPWLMTLDKDGGIITFTDPLSGDKYFINSFPQSLIGQAIICCSKYGWLLMFSGFQSLLFFNPLTRAARQLPPVPAHHSHFSSLGFSSPPTSPNCRVVGFVKPSQEYEWQVIMASPRDTQWRRITLAGFHDRPSFYTWPTFRGLDVYVYGQETQRLGVLREVGGGYIWKVKRGRFSTRVWSHIFVSGPFLVECGVDLLLVFAGGVGELVLVVKMNFSRLMWEEVDDLGRYMICVSETNCFSAVAKVPEMQNNIYFSMFHTGNGNVVFYSLNTRKYHTFNKGNGQEETFTDFFSVKKQMTGVSHLQQRQWPGRNLHGFLLG